MSAASNFTPSDCFQDQILARYHNEGGIQESLDILPFIVEEAYLTSNPTARPARAYMMMCAEGDMTGIIGLLDATGDPEDGDMPASEILRFRDPLDGSKTGLHVAIEKAQPEAVWLLLWLASNLQTQSFPEEVIRAAELMGITNRELTHGPDIRAICNERGQVGRDVAASMGETWAVLLRSGVLE